MTTFTQNTVMALVRPWTLREAPGWRTLYMSFVGRLENDSFWKGAGLRTIRGKRHGFLMELDVTKWSERMAYFLGRWYDLPTQLLAEELLQPGDSVVDIGANIGMFTLAARAQIGSAGRIIAFEPNPTPRKKLERHIALNGIQNVDLFDVALDKQEGRAVLTFPNWNSGEGSLSDIGYAQDETQSVDVEVRVGDDLLKEINPRLVKIDVEGAEIGVLKGLQKLIARARPIITTEYAPKHLVRFAASHKDFEGLAAQHDYRIFSLGMQKINGEGQLKLTPLTSLSNQTDFHEIVLAHRGETSLDRFIG